MQNHFCICESWGALQEKVTQDKNKSMIRRYCVLLLHTQKPLKGKSSFSCSEDAIRTRYLS